MNVLAQGIAPAEQVASNSRARAMVSELDADFAKTIRTGDYRVFLTPEGDCGGLYIKSKGGDGFEVRELQGGTSNVAFSYRIVGRRRDIKRHKRFARIDITPPMQITKERTVEHPAARAQAFARKLRAAQEKHAAALAAKPARGRKGRSRRQRKAGAKASCAEILDHRWHADPVWVASSLRADMAFGRARSL